MALIARKNANRGKVSWTVIVDFGPDPASGKRRQRRVTASSKREAERQAVSLVHKAQTGFTDPSNVTLSEYLGDWLRATKSSIRPSTHRRYSDIVRKHIAPIVGGTKLSKLTAHDVQRLYADRLERSLSPTSVRHIHNLLHHALDDAVKRGLVMRNVCDATDPPKRARREMQVWSRNQVLRVLEVARGDNLEALWRLALATGARRLTSGHFRKITGLGQRVDAVERGAGASDWLRQRTATGDDRARSG